jgi:hypothetical protein
MAPTSAPRPQLHPDEEALCAVLAKVLKRLGSEQPRIVPFTRRRSR